MPIVRTLIPGKRSTCFRWPFYYLPVSWRRWWLRKQHISSPEAEGNEYWETRLVFDDESKR